MIGATAVIAALAGPLYAYATDAAAQLVDPALYVKAVLES
jgi:hypothetical protein